MPPALAFLHRSKLALPSGLRSRLGAAALALLYLAALGVLLRTEDDLVPRLVFLLAWGLLNFTWLVTLRRPAVAAALSLIMLVLLILLSQFKHDVLIMSANFIDVMLIDADTVSFLLTVFPGLASRVAAAVGILLPLLVLLWWLDPFRVRLRVAAPGVLLCLAALGGISLAVPMDRE